MSDFPTIIHLKRQNPTLSSNFRNPTKSNTRAFMDVKLTIPMDTELHNELVGLAAEEHRNKAQMGRVLLKEAIETRKKHADSSPTNAETVPPSDSKD